MFNEQAVVWGAVPAILEAGFDTLVAGGISPEVAFLECVGELKLIAELIEARGIAGMREAISNTAELGATLGGPKIVDAGVRQRMADILGEIRRGEFAEELRREEAEGYPRLNDGARERPRGTGRTSFQEASALTGPGLADHLVGIDWAVADRRALEIGALELAVSGGRIIILGGKGALKFFGSAPREIYAVLLIHCPAPP